MQRSRKKKITSGPTPKDNHWRHLRYCITPSASLITLPLYVATLALRERKFNHDFHFPRTWKDWEDCFQAHFLAPLSLLPSDRT